MASAKNISAPRNRKTATCGLLAVGAAAPWEITLDETISGPERWFVQIDGPAMCLQFEIPSVDIIGEALQFLQPKLRRTKVSSNGSTDRFLISKRKSGVQVTILKDDEYSDRFFLTAQGTDSFTARLTIAGTDLSSIVESLRQIESELDDR